MKSWLLPLKSRPLPSVPTPNSIDLCHEGLCTKVDTSAHTPNFSLCGYKKAPRSVIHLWEKGQEEEAQVSLDSQFEKIIPRSCVPRLWVQKLGCISGWVCLLGPLDFSPHGRGMAGGKPEWKFTGSLKQYYSEKYCN